MKKNHVCAGVVLSVALLGAGCRKTEEAKPTAATVEYSKIDSATAGVVQGTVFFKGKAPARVEIDMMQDPVCGIAEKNMSEQYVVHDGRLANVFVYVKDGLGGKVYAPPTTAVTLDQKGCRYTPHVIGVMAGQPVEFTNSDATMHNVHLMPEIGGNQSVDLSQPPRGGTTTRVFAQPESMIPVRCNNHPWMEGFINVAPSPFYAVTDENGHFELKGLPPGTYSVVAVHEKFGRQATQVTVKEKTASVNDFTFSN